ncbi:MAG: 4-phosphoerythronate dehydrogenase [Kiritimatiellia bacterium]
MKIICANSVTLGRELLSPLGEVAWMDEEAITAPVVRDADALVIRSKTRVDAALVEGSRLRFVGTCTAGTDHVDETALAARGIRFASAGGCNANAVSEYLVAALLELADRKGFTLEGLTLGIVGHGHVGKWVEKKARALGLEVLLNDPPLADRTGDSRYLPLDAVIRGADILTFHTPLHEDGPYRSRGLFNPANAPLLRHGAILVNACRGEVVAPDTLRALAAEPGRLRGLVLDVWDPEPMFPVDLLESVDLGSPHIAGHSFEGKLNGTTLVVDALAALNGSPACVVPPELLPPAPGIRWPGSLTDLVRAAYDITEDDRLLRAVAALPDPARGKAFNRLRRDYRLRREFPAVMLAGVPVDPGLRERLQGLGFHLRAAP